MQMKLFTKMVVALVYCIYLPFTFASSQEIKIVYNQVANPPYNMGDHSQELPGISVELLNKAAEELGINITFIVAPWKRALIMLEEGAVDALMDASFNTKRAKFGVYPYSDDKPDVSKRTNRQAYYLYTLKGKEPTFTDSIFGATRGYSIIDNLVSKGVSKDRIIETTGSTSSLGMLRSKRIDAIADLAVNIEPLLSDSKDVVRIEPELKAKEYYLIFSKGFIAKSPSVAKNLWDKIGDLRESDFGKSLSKKYIK